MRTAILFGLAIVMAGCESPGELVISGRDGITAEAIAFDGTATSAICRNMFVARVEGIAEGSATIVDGRLIIKRMDGDTISDTTWNEENVRQFWPEVTVQAGDSIVSQPYSISTSLPMPELEGRLAFRYRINDGGGVKTTVPFVYTCRATSPER